MCITILSFIVQRLISMYLMCWWMIGFHKIIVVAVISVNIHDLMTLFHGKTLFLVKASRAMIFHSWCKRVPYISLWLTNMKLCMCCFFDFQDIKDIPRKMENLDIDCCVERELASQSQKMHRHGPHGQ